MSTLLFLRFLDGAGFGLIMFVTASIIIVSLYYFARLRADAAKKKIPNQYTVAFFHPYCNAGGGGERVLWCSIQSIQSIYPNAKCYVYTGDDATPPAIINKAKDSFNIDVKNVEFIYLKKRWSVEAETYKYFRILGQSLGSMILAFEALFKLNPNLYIDTMGYAFTFPIFKLVGRCKVAGYVHYPTVSTDMISILNTDSSLPLAKRVKSFVKILYYRLFAIVYGFMGRFADVIMVNSTWTKEHIDKIWQVPKRTFVVYPPCDVTGLTAIPSNWNTRENLIISIGQFRPEKNHKLQIQSFAKLRNSYPPDQIPNDLRLVLIGGARDERDRARVKDLQNYALSLGVDDFVLFAVEISNADLKDYLARALIGIHTMWCEHFGIGVVEYQAAGLITIAHNSGGPKADIVEHGKTGFLATTPEEYAECMKKVLNNRSSEVMEAVQISARHSVKRFSEDSFDSKFRGVFMSPTRQ